MEYVDEVIDEKKIHEGSIEWLDDNEEMIDFDDDDIQFNDVSHSTNPLQEL